MDIYQLHYKIRYISLLNLHFSPTLLSFHLFLDSHTICCRYHLMLLHHLCSHLALINLLQSLCYLLQLNLLYSHCLLILPSLNPLFLCHQHLPLQHLAHLDYYYLKLALSSLQYLYLFHHK